MRLDLPSRRPRGQPTRAEAALRRQPPQTGRGYAGHGPGRKQPRRPARHDPPRYYERHGFLPAPAQTGNRYREYSDADADRLRLLLGLRQLDLPLEQAAELAAELAGMCAEGRYDDVSVELRAAIGEKRTELRRRMAEMSYLDRRLAHLEGDLAVGEPPRPLIALGKEVHGDAM